MKTVKRSETIEILVMFLAFLVVFGVCLVKATWGHGFTTVTLTTGQSIFVDLSARNLNLIKFPTPGVRVYTGSKVLDIKIDEGNVFLKFMGEVISPQEIFFVAPSGVYSMILVPKEIPAQTVIVRVPEEDINDALNWEISHNYVSGLKELIKAMYEGKPPRGFSIKEIKEDRSLWKEVKTTLKQTYIGATLQGDVYELTNITASPVRFSEKEFYEKGVLAVSIEKHELRPGEKTDLYIVRKTKTQRSYEDMMRRENPLNPFGVYKETK